MPMENYANAPRATDSLSTLIYAQLASDSISLVPDSVLRKVLRSHRIRNTIDIPAADLQVLHDETGADLLLLSSLNHFANFTGAAEVSVAMRLLDLPTGEIRWAEALSRHSNNRIFRLPGTNGNKRLSLATKLIRKLSHRFTTKAYVPRRCIDESKLKRASSQSRSSASRIAVMPLANSTQSRFAGELISSQVISELVKDGFYVVDPGLVRGSMFASSLLSRGEVAMPVLNHLQSAVRAEWVLTGTVRKFREWETSDERGDCEVALDLRLISASTGTIVWSNSISRKGSEFERFFGIGALHGAACLSDKLVRHLVAGIPSYRLKVRELKNNTSTLTHQNN
jgi:TolB-like protein